MFAKAERSLTEGPWRRSMVIDVGYEDVSPVDRGARIASVQASASVGIRP